MNDDLLGSILVVLVLLGFGILGALLGGYYLHLVWIIGRTSWGWV